MDEVKTKDGKKKKAALLVFFIVAVGGAITLFLYLGYKATHITTDDAYVEGAGHVIAPKIEGTVQNVPVRDNQFVKDGELLVEIDDADFDVRVREAASAVKAERSRLTEILSKMEVIRKQIAEVIFRISTARANLDLQQANLKQAETDLTRAEKLYRSDAISKERYEKAKTGHDVAVAQMNATEQQLRQAEASLDTKKALITEAESAFSHRRRWSNSGRRSVMQPAAVGCPPFQPSWCQTGMDFVVDWHEIGTKMSLTAYKMGVTQKSSKRDFLPPYHPIVLVPAAFLASGMHLWLVAGGPATWSTALALAMLVPAGERCKFRASLLGHHARGQEVPS